MTAVADFLRGYIHGYWQGFEFAETRPKAEVLEETGSASGDADAASPAPGSGPTTRCSAPAGLKSEPASVGPAPSAVDSLPAIRQLALPGDVEVAGELERLVLHRGMVTALSDMAQLLARLGHIEAARLCLAATDIQRDGVDT